jgi:hypothetical protein
MSRRTVRAHLTNAGRWIGRLAMCAMLCTVLSAIENHSARAEDASNACLRADATTKEQIAKLRKTKKERNSIAEPANLKPWMDKVKEQSKAARGELTKALELCRNDQQLGQRVRRGAVSRLKKRLRFLDETDKQMKMMQALGHPDPRIDPSVLRVLER